MSKFKAVIWTALAILLLAVLPLSLAKAEYYTADPVIVDYALGIACQHRGTPPAICGSPYGVGAKLPAIVYADLLDTEDAWGVYDPAHPGEIAIDITLAHGLVNHNEADIKALFVLVHEMTHYVDDHQWGLKDGDGCSTEAHAWSVANTWALDVGVPEQANFDWAQAYPGCATN